MLTVRAATIAIVTSDVAQGESGIVYVMSRDAQSRSGGKTSTRIVSRQLAELRQVLLRVVLLAMAAAQQEREPAWRATAKSPGSFVDSA
jgi:hypothetical protein